MKHDQAGALARAAQAKDEAADGTRLLARATGAGSVGPGQLRPCELRHGNDDAGVAARYAECHVADGQPQRDLFFAERQPVENAERDREAEPARSVLEGFEPGGRPLP